MIDILHNMIDFYLPQFWIEQHAHILVRVVFAIEPPSVLLMLIYPNVLILSSCINFLYVKWRIN